MAYYSDDCKTYLQQSTYQSGQNLLLHLCSVQTAFQLRKPHQEPVVLQLTLCTSRKLKMPENYFSLNMSSPSSGLPSLFPSHLLHSSVLVNLIGFVFMFIEANAIAQSLFSIFKLLFSSGCRESLFLNGLWVPNLLMRVKSKQEI